ncbi:MAG: PbpA [Desulfobacterales bacterium]|nr:PbpA [Desulfobacterales bacterium]
MTIGVHFFSEEENTSAHRKKPLEEKIGLGADVVRSLLAPEQLASCQKDTFTAHVEGKPVEVKTTLNMELQELLISEFKRNIAKKRETPRYVSAVALDPETGRIISLVGLSSDKGSVNPSIEAHYPAASIFKIITASAAVETLHFSPTTRLNFNGGKYTLYKRQLTEKKNRYTNTITLRDAFAQSVNPVFGKLGTLKLKGKKLKTYGEKFFFNRPIEFDLPVQPSVLSIEEDPYQWAEVACGFNRATKISPLHGALIAATAINGGVLPAPYLIEKVTGETQENLYSAQAHDLGRVTTTKASQTVEKLMERTIRSGTARKSFSGYRRDAVLKDLVLGGKTGSIFNKGRDVRVDWFVGFAKEKRGQRAMAIAVVVGHQKYIGTRASTYARMAMTNYFSQPPQNTQVADTGKTETTG